MIWAIIFMFINNISLYLLGSVNKQNVVAKIIILGAIFNIVFNLLLIPQFSYIGSSVVTVITEIIMLPLFIYILHKTEYVNLGSLIKDLPKILIANLVLLIVIYYLSNLNLLLTLIIGTLIYLFMIYITKSLDDNDIKLFRSLLK